MLATESNLKNIGLAKISIQVLKHTNRLLANPVLEDTGKQWCDLWTTVLCLKNVLIIFVKIFNKLLWDKTYQSPDSRDKGNNNWGSLSGVPVTHGF